MTTKHDSKLRRQHKTRARTQGKRLLPRLSVYRSHTSLYVQVIDDLKGVTVAAAHSREVTGTKSRMEQAEKLGEIIAKKAQDQKISDVRFDRGSYKYHGLVKAVAEGARKGGLVF